MAFVQHARENERRFPQTFVNRHTVSTAGRNIRPFFQKKPKQKLRSRIEPLRSRFLFSDPFAEEREHLVDDRPAFLAGRVEHGEPMAERGVLRGREEAQAVLDAAAVENVVQIGALSLEKVVLGRREIHGRQLHFRTQHVRDRAAVAVRGIRKILAEELPAHFSFCRQNAVGDEVQIGHGGNEPECAHIDGRFVRAVDQAQRFVAADDISEHRQQRARRIAGEKDAVRIEPVDRRVRAHPSHGGEHVAHLHGKIGVLGVRVVDRQHGKAAGCERGAEGARVRAVGLRPCAAVYVQDHRTLLPSALGQKQIGQAHVMFFADVRQVINAARAERGRRRGSGRAGRIVHECREGRHAETTFLSNVDQRRHVADVR